MKKELLHVCLDYEVSATELWPIVADLNAYADHVTGLASTEVTSGSGVGATRTCRTVKGETWSEVVAVWEPGQRFVMEVDTATYPFPLKQLFRAFTATWELTPTPSGSQVCITFFPNVRAGWLLWPLVKFGARQSRRDLEYTLESYRSAAERLTTDT